MAAMFHSKVMNDVNGQMVGTPRRVWLASGQHFCNESLTRHLLSCLALPASMVQHHGHIATNPKHKGKIPKMVTAAGAAVIIHHVQQFHVNLSAQSRGQGKG